MLWEPYPSYHNGLFSPLLVRRDFAAKRHLDVMLSTCAQLLWTTYPRPVLSGPRTCKTLDDLSHCAAAQFQDVGNLLVALTIFM